MLYILYYVSLFLGGVRPGHPVYILWYQDCILFFYGYLGEVYKDVFIN